MHMEQSVFWLAQNLKHFSASTVHLDTPIRLERLYTTGEGGSNGIALGGQPAAQRSQMSQKAFTPNALGTL